MGGRKKTDRCPRQIEGFHTVATIDNDGVSKGVLIIPFFWTLSAISDRTRDESQNLLLHVSRFNDVPFSISLSISIPPLASHGRKTACVPLFHNDPRESL